MDKLKKELFKTGLITEKEFENLKQKMNMDDFNAYLYFFLTRSLILTHSNIFEDIKKLIKKVNSNELDSKLELATVIKILELIMLEKRCSYDDKVQLLQSIKSATEEKELEQEGFTNKFKEEVQKEINSIVTEFSQYYMVRNSFKEIEISTISINLTDFKNNINEYINNYPFHYYLTKEQFKEYLNNAHDEQIKKLYVYLNSIKNDLLTYHQTRINELNELLKNSTIDISSIERELQLEKNLYQYYNVDISTNPEPIFVLLFNNPNKNSSFDLGLGRGFEHRKLISSKISKTRKVGELDYFSEITAITKDPKMLQNDMDLRKRIGSLKNLLQYLNTDVLTLYGQALPFNYKDQCANRKQVDKKSKIVVKYLKTAQQPLRISQKEFSLTNENIENFINCNKYLINEVTNEFGEYKIYWGECNSFYYLFIKETFYAEDDIDNILYILPNGDINAAQQLLRIDTLNPQSGKTFLPHRPKGDRVIQTIHHQHTYHEIDVLFKTVEVDGNPKIENLAHNEIDFSLSSILGIEDLDKFLIYVARLHEGKNVDPDLILYS